MNAHVPPATAPTDPLTRALVEALAPAVREAVAEAIAEHAPAPATALLTTDELAYQLRTSRTTLHRLRGEGLPTILIGDSPRYRLDAVIGWLEARAAP